MRAVSLIAAMLLAIAIPLTLGYTQMSADREREQKLQAKQASQAKQVASTDKLLRDGNWKEALTAASQVLFENAAATPQEVAVALEQAVTSLQQLGRLEELDDVLERAVTKHAQNWRLLQVAGTAYLQNQHQGYILSGKFTRGYSRGAARYVNAFERDRVRALQLFTQAMPLAERDADRAAAAELFWQVAQAFIGERYYAGAWQLQILTDLTTLPDHDEGYGGGRGASSGAPVAADGTPVYYRLPASWTDAKNDGERWRWALEQTARLNPARANEMKYTRASFLHQQFGVQTMAHYGWFFGRMGADDAAGANQTYQLHTLREDETLARLATGVQRFTLPADMNAIRLYDEVAQGGGDYATQAQRQLAQIFTDRRQYAKAADYYERVGDKAMVEQIRGNWGQFEAISTQPAGEAATVDFRFRNGRMVYFEAYRIDVPRLLGDVKSYLKSAPRQLDGNRMQLDNLGYQFVQEKPSAYVGEKVTSWTKTLTPRANHFDARVSVQTPLTGAGAYLLVARMADGNESRIVLWLADTVIVKKPLDGKQLLFVADARTGKPLPGVTLEAFGYRNQWVNDPVTHAGRHELTVREATVTTNADGQAILEQTQASTDHQWLITASGDGRLAFLGFTGVWYPRAGKEIYAQAKTFVITDRPVYRPGNPVKFKCWANTARYDATGPSPFAGKPFVVRIFSPKGEKVYEKSLTADNYGGVEGEFIPALDATLGAYSLQVVQQPQADPKSGGVGGNASFRVEEYKKPEFEVKVEAPDKPVLLGEKITALVKATYYFGAPVTQGQVKYKVLRSAQTGRWYPEDRWDWLYGPGYWWYAADCAWYPGWREWGCYRPVPVWWGRSYEQPELVAENTVALDHAGTARIVIDTALAKAMFADRDHRYDITAEVTDQSRRTIVGQGSVQVARKPFTVTAWTDRGYYRVGDQIRASFAARTLAGTPVAGKGTLKLLQVRYQADPASGELIPDEREVGQWTIATNDDGRLEHAMKAVQAGQYRLSYALTDSAKHTIEGGYLFTVIGDGFSGKDVRFTDLELIPDKRSYAPGEAVNLLVNTEQADASVLLFVRPSNGIYPQPKLLRLAGKSTLEAIAVTAGDMPNFFVEAVTVADGKIYTEMREIVVPPEQRVLNVQVTPTAPVYHPGDKASMTVKVTDLQGKPVQGALALTLYDKAVEYISGGSNVPAIREFFWKWRRSHHPQTEHTLGRACGNLVPYNKHGMQFLGAFGASVADEMADADGMAYGGAGGKVLNRNRGGMLEEQNSMRAMKSAAPGAPMDATGMMSDRREAASFAMAAADKSDSGGEGAGEGPLVEATVRTNFADTALWVGSVETDAKGEATVSLTMPENLTTWKAKTWAMGQGTACGEGNVEVRTAKNLLVRLQTPRFLVQKDEVVFSANVHNYLGAKKKVRVSLEVAGGCLKPTKELGRPFNPANDTLGTQTIEVPANGDLRVDWRATVVQPGWATVRVKALTDVESDAMELQVPVVVHGMFKTESWSGAIRPEADRGTVTIKVPAERQPEHSRLEIRYSPTLAGAMVDAIPYLVDYPYDFTEATLNRFLPTALTYQALKRMGVNLAEIKDKRTNLNAQERGDAATRMAEWKRLNSPNPGVAERNPVFDEAEVTRMIAANLNRLASMQCGDGGWGWFSGWGEQSYPHTTALVVHGLQVAKASGIVIPNGMLERGVQWLQNYQTEQVRRLKLPDGSMYHKHQADAQDAFTYLTLVEAKADNLEMRDFLYRDRVNLPVYAKCLFALALHTVGDVAKRDDLRRNIEQFLVQDEENQTAYLRLPANNAWWYWYGSEIEAQAAYLKLLTKVDPQGPVAPRLVKYLLNNRKHATYWQATRDTALVIEAFADYLKASGEDKPNMAIDVRINGRTVKTVTVTPATLFTFDNVYTIAGAVIPAGTHTIELVKRGTGPLYYNVYLTNFTLEDPITKAGLEVKVQRKIYKLTPADAKLTMVGERGQVVGGKREKFDRTLVTNQTMLKSGDLLEVELELESKNDYEYLLLEDIKAAGCEPVDVRSGYGNNELGAYMELRDMRVSFFLRTLARGKHSLTYRVRAETPGAFSAMPTCLRGVYAFELAANADEAKINIQD
jgi:uncharacterized protein YfaS (alpha-2-macroglobulin family)